MRRFSWPPRIRWTPRRLATLLVGSGCLGIVMIVALAVVSGGLVYAPIFGGIVRRAVAPACLQVTPAAPDFQAAPFAFDPVARASAFLQALADEDFRTAYEMSAPEPLPADSLCNLELETDDVALALVGLDVFPKSVELQRDTTDPSVSLFFSPALDLLEVEFRVAPRFHVTVSLLRDGRVLGFEIDEAVQELGSVRDYPPPAYADAAAFEETEVVIGEAPWALGGTLTLPHGPGPFPAVVLVPGSDRYDRDDTAGGNKPYRDLAWGLATQGVATLRYEKRTWVHALAFARQPVFTLDDALVDDALAAVSVVRETPRIDPTRVYVLGNGLGGFAAPRIAQRDPEIAGLVLISAASGSFFHRALQAYEDSVEALELTDEYAKQFMEMLRSRVASLDALAAGQTVEPDMLARSSYVRDLAAYRPEETTYALRIPMLILYGASDRPVAESDMLGWMQRLRGDPGAAYRLYHGHDRVLLDGQRKTGPALRRRGHVGQGVIDDIVAWLGGGWSTQSCADFDALLEGCFH